MFFDQRIKFYKLAEDILWSNSIKPNEKNKSRQPTTQYQDILTFGIGFNNGINLQLQMYERLEIYGVVSLLRQLILAACKTISNPRPIVCLGLLSSFFLLLHTVNVMLHGVVWPLDPVSVRELRLMTTTDTGEQRAIGGWWSEGREILLGDANPEPEKLLGCVIPEWCMDIPSHPAH